MNIHIIISYPSNHIQRGKSFHIVLFQSIQVLFERNQTDARMNPRKSKFIFTYFFSQNNRRNCRNIGTFTFLDYDIPLPLYFPTLLISPRYEHVHASLISPQPVEPKMAEF